MELDQKGSKWNKIVNQLRAESEDEEETEEDEEARRNEEENRTIDEDIRSELANSKTFGQEEDSNLISSVNMTIQWLDRMCGITPSTTRGQNIYMACMLLIPLVPIFALVIQML